MKFRPFGSSGLQVSEIGFGAWAIGGNAHGNSYGGTNDEESLQAIAAALELGCNFFDTADVYGHGHSEELLGKALKGRRSQIIVATKGGSDFEQDPPRLNFTESHLLQAVEQSLRRLNTEYIDLYQLHNPPFSLVQNGHIFEVLEKLKVQGKIRFYGISIHDPQEGLMALKIGSPTAIQVVYNYLRRDAAEELFPRAVAQGVAIIAREPLANGFLTGKYTKDSIFPVGDIRHQWPSKYQTQLLNQVQDYLKTISTSPFSPTQNALRFVLAQPAVAVTIPGCKTASQAEENCKSSDLSFSQPSTASQN
jgi:aryl-alcohol dehydrogenase-like predicted oxidoreductase